jgi:hypothetical protein
MSSANAVRPSALQLMIDYFLAHYERIDSNGGAYDYVSDDPSPVIVERGRLELLQELNAHLRRRGYERVSQKSEAWRQFRLHCLNTSNAPSMYSSEHNTTHSVERACGSGSNQRKLRLAVRRNKQTRPF